MEQQTEEHVHNEAPEAVAPTGTSSNKNNIMLAAGAIVVLAVIVGALLLLKPQTNQGPVAMVNGTEITRTEYQNLLGQVQPEGGELNEEEKQAFINQLIDQELIIQDARASGYTASDEEVEEEYLAIVAQLGSEEELENRLAATGVSEAELREGIAEQILFQKYIEGVQAEEEITVTDEEVRAFYDTATATGGEAPEYEAVAEQLRQQLLEQELGAVLQERVEMLRADADIEIFI